MRITSTVMERYFGTNWDTTVSFLKRAWYMGKGSGQKVNAYHVNRILIITFHMSGNWSNLSIKLKGTSNCNENLHHRLIL